MIQDLIEIQNSYELVKITFMINLRDYSLSLFPITIIQTSEVFP